MELQVAALKELEVYVPSLTAEGEALVEAATTGLMLICKVDNEDQNRLAVEAQVKAKETLDLLEKTRVAIGGPALEFKRKVDAFFNSKKAELEAEMSRTRRLTGSYLQLQEAKRRAEENARREELTRLEREREAALAASKTHDEREQLQAHYNERAAVESMPPPNPMAKPKGQVGKQEWEVEIADIWALARANPGCVKIEPRLTEIKALLNAGINPPGVLARKVMTATVRSKSGPVVNV